MALLDTVRSRLILLFSLVLVIPSAYGISEAVRHFFQQREFAYSSIDRYVALAAADVAGRLDDVTRLGISLSHEDPLLQAADMADKRQSCSTLLARAIRPYPTYSNAMLFDVKGKPICGARMEQGDIQIQDRLWFQAVLTRKDLAVSGFLIARGTGEPAIIFGMPVLDEAGRLKAVLALAVRTAWLQPQGLVDGMAAGQALSILDKSGLSAAETIQDDLQPTRYLPSQNDLTGLLAGDLLRFEAQGRDGTLRIYAVDRVGRYDLYVVLGQDRSEVIGPLWRDLVVQCSVLLLIFGFGLLTVIVGARLLITRWTERLTRLARDYIGAKQVSLRKMMRAPREFRRLSESIQEMGRRVDEHELQHLQSLDAKREMLRELHHRVKNNMQIVNSYLNLYARTSRASPFRTEIEELQLRTSALALVQRHLYDDENLKEVRIAPILTQLCHHFSNRAGQSAELTFAASDANATLAADRVVSLVLLITEVVSRVLYLARDEGDGGQVALFLGQSDLDTSYVRIIAYNLDPALSIGVTSKDRPMITAFIKQLRAHISLSDQRPFEIRIAFRSHELELPAKALDLAAAKQAE
ncbi:MAG TPA: histidine kinase dimerization/phosphoacceptor domain -containing protein [Dongiaceae bacterium]|nr:histidine kinase dimerization/phosphoacceptor domain -containing protein [Dongiaceae bacterium]